MTINKLKMDKIPNTNTTENQISNTKANFVIVIEDKL